MSDDHAVFCLELWVPCSLCCRKTTTQLLCQQEILTIFRCILFKPPLLWGYNLSIMNSLSVILTRASSSICPCGSDVMFCGFCSYFFFFHFGSSCLTDALSLVCVKFSARWTRRDSSLSLKISVFKVSIVLSLFHFTDRYLISHSFFHAMFFQRDRSFLSILEIIFTHFAFNNMPVRVGAYPLDARPLSPTRFLPFRDLFPKPPPPIPLAYKFDGEKTSLFNFPPPPQTPP